MGKSLFALLLIFSFGFSFAQENPNLTTLRIGSYKIKMTKEEAEKIAKTSLLLTDHSQENRKKNMVKYSGEEIEVEITENYVSETEPNVLQISALATKSPKFRTKNGMGVGSTRKEILNAYLDYPNFSVDQKWDYKTNKNSTKISAISLEDRDAWTTLEFTLVDNFCTEVSVHFTEEGD
ncbi:hypothetical protein N6B72_13815 [Chryseobacterium soli]|uniref:hypothetical protein n=1 Tax=Chryseobacterium soli TaxID=445961 RepID=UPI002952A54E|nr:hypothetical protein [Chryseobacterium soli]MDV7697998.1 hypothetical protein [Chryseobacterium soli]